MHAVRERFRHSFRTLRSRNFRLFLLGQLLSLSGSWAQQVAVGWLVYRLTQSPLLLGVVGFSSQFPSLLSTPVAGVWADRFDRQRILIACQTGMMIQATLLAVLVLTGSVTVWHVIALSVCLALLQGIEIPTRQSFFVELVEDRADLPNAIALNSSTFNASRLVGPAAAGLLISKIGEGGVFVLNAVSFSTVIAALLMMDVARRPQAASSQPMLAVLREGVSYAWRSQPIRALLSLVAVVSFFGIPFNVLLPIFARDVFGGGPDTLGFLVPATGLGALVGALYLAGRRSVRGLGRVIACAATTFAASLVVLGALDRTLPALALLFVTGAGLLVMLASTNTVLQTIVENDKRGRVMSLYTMSFLGTIPLGSLLAGYSAARLGASLTVTLGACFALLAIVAYWRAFPALRAQVLPVYARLGILPEG